jgi:hypothetical protein
MSKKADFVKSIHGLNETDLKARLEEEKLRLKKLEFAHAISPPGYCPFANGIEVKATASIKS